MTRRRTVRPNMYRGILAGLGLLAWALHTTATDARQVFSGEAYPWLRAIGKLQVPGQRLLDGHQAQYMEDCSATLVARPGRSRADIIITAWHCLEWYGDLSKPITFTVVTAAGELLRREAFRLADGGGMHADWAILRLRGAVPAHQVRALPLSTGPVDPNRRVTMAGYSGDPGMGDRGNVLTFDVDCAVTAQERDLVDTDCTAFKGASGGAVIQLSSTGEPFVCGVISQGDGEGRSTFFPVLGFRGALALHLN